MSTLISYFQGNFTAEMAETGIDDAVDSSGDSGDYETDDTQDNARDYANQMCRCTRFQVFRYFFVNFCKPSLILVLLTHYDLTP